MHQSWWTVHSCTPTSSRAVALGDIEEASASWEARVATFLMLLLSVVVDTAMLTFILLVAERLGSEAVARDGA